jgi:hypothetical protein
MELQLSAKPSNEETNSPLVAFQMRTLPSAPPVASVLPSGKNAMAAA